MSLSPRSLLPRRNPGLIERVFGKYARADPTMGPQEQQQETTQSGTTGEGGQRNNPWADYFKVAYDRQSVYDDVEELDEQSEEANVALDTVADNACTSADGTMQACVLSSPTPAVQRLLDDLARRIKLKKALYSWIRSELKYGDIFAEVIVNGDGDIVGLQTLPAKTMHRNEDAQGNLLVGKPVYNAEGQCQSKLGECAFEQRTMDDSSKLVAAFYPWQVIHGRWNWDGHSRYGRSYLRLSRVAWKKLHAEEEALIIGRLVRALLKLVFYIDTTGLPKEKKKQAIRNFKESVSKRVQLDGARENPFNVLTDFFISTETIPMRGQVVQSQTKIDVIDPRNEGLQQIEDIKHFHRKFLSTLRVPPAYLGFEEDVNSKNTLSAQDVQFIRFLRRVQAAETDFLAELIDIQLVLKGYDPQATEYDITWPALSVNDQLADAEAMLKTAQAMAIYLGKSSMNQRAVLTPEYVLEHIFELNKQELAEMIADLEEQDEEDLEALQAGAKTNDSTAGSDTSIRRLPPPATDADDTEADVA